MLAVNVPALGEVANFGTDYFLSKIKFLARNKREFTTKFAILPSLLTAGCVSCVALGYEDRISSLKMQQNFIRDDRL